MASCRSLRSESGWKPLLLIPHKKSVPDASSGFVLELPEAGACLGFGILKATLKRLTEKFPGDLCPEDVLALLAAKRRSVEDGSEKTPLAVGFSGGPDSFFLLLWLKAHFPVLTGFLRVLHFNHRTRPGENDREADRARDMAEGLGLEFFAGVAPPGIGCSEDQLRCARFAFFEDEMERLRSRILLLGHQADDVAETMLARLARGSGPEGLAAPHPVREHRRGWTHLRVRPLLRIPGESLRRFLSESGFAPVEDPSNQREQYQRNRIRHQVLPAWKAACDRDVLPGITRSRFLTAEMVDFIEESARRLAPEGWGTARLHASAFQGQFPAPVRFLLHRWLATHRKEIGPELSDTIVQSAIRGEFGKWTIGAGCWIVLSEEEMVLEDRGCGGRATDWRAVRWTEGETLFLPDGAVLSRERLAPDPVRFSEICSGKEGTENQVFLQPREGCGSELVVRLWQPGDRYRPLGAPGSRKLQDWFTDRKIDTMRRRLLPVVTSGERILWVPGFPPAQEDRLLCEEESLLSLTYCPAWRNLFFSKP